MTFYGMTFSKPGIAECLGSMDSLLFEHYGLEFNESVKCCSVAMEKNCEGVLPKEIPGEKRSPNS